MDPAIKDCLEKTTSSMEIRIDLRTTPTRSAPAPPSWMNWSLADRILRSGLRTRRRNRGFAARTSVYGGGGGAEALGDPRTGPILAAADGLPAAGINAKELPTATHSFTGSKCR